MAENKRKYTPKNDVVFRMLFGEQENEKITKSLIEDVLEEKVEIIDLRQNPYLLGETPDDKVGIIDIKAIMNNNIPLDIEMQIVDNDNLEERILFYWARMYTKQIERGDDYKELNRCISIIFLDYSLEKLKSLPIHTKWQIKESENGKIILTNRLEIHIIELTKVVDSKCNEELEKWLLFLKNPYGEETRKMAKEKKEIKEALEKLEEINNDEQKARMAELREKYILDRKSELRTAERKGMEKGMEKGAEKRQIRNSKKIETKGNEHK